MTNLDLIAVLQKPPRKIEYTKTHTKCRGVSRILFKYNFNGVAPYNTLNTPRYFGGSIGEIMNSNNVYRSAVE